MAHRHVAGWHIYHHFCVFLAKWIPVAGGMWTCFYMNLLFLEAVWLFTPSPHFGRERPLKSLFQIMDLFWSLGVHVKLWINCSRSPVLETDLYVSCHAKCVSSLKAQFGCLNVAQHHLKWPWVSGCVHHGTAMQAGTKWAPQEIWQCWTDSWKWAFLQSQSTKLAAWSWARGLQSSLTTPFSCISSSTVLATLGTPWLLAFPPNPSAEGAAAPRPAGPFPLCSLSRWLVGLAETRPFSLFRNFYLQWLAILHNLTKPLLYPISPVQYVLYCHPVDIPLITPCLLLL